MGSEDFRGSIEKEAVFPDKEVRAGTGHFADGLALNDDVKVNSCIFDLLGHPGAVEKQWVWMRRPFDRMPVTLAENGVRRESCTGGHFKGFFSSSMAILRNTSRPGRGT